MPSDTLYQAYNHIGKLFQELEMNKAYLRTKWEDIEYVGKLFWLL